MSESKIGVLVMSYGTPESLDQVEAYYTHIRRGNPPSPEQLKELTDRYDAIVGGFFPLRQHTNDQVANLQKKLNDQFPDRSFVCYQGLKHAAPFIEDGIDQMAADGITQAVGIVLAPHYSTMSVGSYIKRAKEQAAKHDLNIQFVESYHLQPELLTALVERVETALQKFQVDKSNVKVLFSAHSLPARILEMNDPYPQQLMETSEAIAARTGLANWQFSWQSAGQTGVPWLGPDILEDIERLVKEEGEKHLLICPIGFVSDHLEVLYDIDIECKQLAEELGAQLERTASLNSDPRYMQCLAEAIYEQLEG
ncbi:ferrochelatase [Marinicrinis sediminis]|uniref:Coproporphyrin III ferrochelatase n=1 Tax=Marinicrinis sediminis TaxID=1652465 RepID=A0ABW5R683_9BACL